MVAKIIVFTDVAFGDEIVAQDFVCDTTLRLICFFIGNVSAYPGVWSKRPRIFATIMTNLMLLYILIMAKKFDC